jgi:hypothetical protein
MKTRTATTAKNVAKSVVLALGLILIAGPSALLPMNARFEPFHPGRAQAFAIASQTYPPQGAAHYRYVFPDGNMYVHDLDNNFALVYSTSLPTSTGGRGAVASPATGMLYVSYGSASTNPGSLMKYNLITTTVVWTKTYTFGIDSMGIR